MSASTGSPSYLRLILAFARNSLVREMQFRGNFLIDVVTRAFWFTAQVTMFDLIYRNVPDVNGWSRYEFFAFMATGMIINTLIEALFMPNCANFSELIRTGNLDFVLLKPIDTQFLVSFEKLDLGALGHLLLNTSLLGYALWQLDRPVSAGQVFLYLGFILVAVTFFYSLMISLASTSIWLGQNQGLYDFWFYITIFARYPRSFYRDAQIPGAPALLFLFSYLLPILLVVTVPAEQITRHVRHPADPTWLVIVAPLAAVAGLFVSRHIFKLSLKSYRSASS